MAKTNTLQARVAAQAASADRDAIMAALVKAVAKAPPMPRVLSREEFREAAKAHEATLPSKRKRTSFSRVGFRRYEVLDSNAGFSHKRGTWTRFMVSTITSHEDTRAATKAHAESGQYTEKTLDFNWMVKQGYIAYK